MISIYCYGHATASCRGGFGVVSVDETNREIVDLMVSRDKKTNIQEQELKSLLYALESCHRRGHIAETHIIYCESAYPVMVYHKLLPIWEKRGWKDKDGKNLKYTSILKLLYYYYTKNLVNFQVKKRESDITIIPQQLAKAYALQEVKHSQSLLKQLKKDYPL